MPIVEGLINGFDLCSLQDSYKPVDFAAAKSAGFDFVYIKSSQYSSTVDGRFASLRDRARNAGLAVGAYHFCSHDSDPYAQAAFFYRSSENLGTVQGDLPPMCDWEFCTPSKYKDHPQHCVDWLVSFAGEVKRLWYPHEDRQPIIYTYPNYSGMHQPSLEHANVALSVFGLCFASYTPGQVLQRKDQIPAHPLPKPWTSWTLCQHKGNDGRVPGVTGACDMSVFNGSSADFARFRGIDRPGGPQIFGRAAETDVNRAFLRTNPPRERYYPGTKL